MRSACWGAMSARSLITMRPLGGSIPLAFPWSRLAGSGGGRGNSKIVVGRSLEGATGLLGDGRTYRLEHLQPFLDRKQRLFAGIDRHRDNQAVAQGHGMLDHVQMAVGDRVKRAGIK